MDDQKERRFVIAEDGFINMSYASSIRQEQSRFVQIGWIIGDLLRTLKSIDNVRALGGLPDAEYIVELEFESSVPSDTISVIGWNTAFNDSIGGLSPLPFSFPRLSYGLTAEADSVITQANTDIFDACGAGQLNPMKLSVRP